ncbi:YlzJ-like family protein [Tepidanaerobacter acetatoxydans]|uniref:YlzJ-like family protein n=1 Tax=Tepidanaerobacter acetatoxydans TaxID=499229 RepID=UPI001BD3C443|nr:YlzJ-like family protein [Tepidanaerobacter acetatoxydans]
MLLYTTMPLEIVLDGIYKEHEYKEIDTNGVKLIVECIGINQGKIVRLLSSNPQDFLNPNFFPGKIITFSLQ